ncbi:MAG: XRE family transcriptional regulator [Cytophagales bacterium]|nr:XRE family transcriptional regulator [Cytophagales bacterium]MDW8383604.1 S24 family peptidase [Flammeovirgaceae bacterium]
MADKKDLNKFFSKNLRYLRENYPTKLTQEKLAEQLTLLCRQDDPEAKEVTRNNICSYEDGRAEPKLEILSYIAKFFNITVDHLLRIDLGMYKLEDIQHKEDIKKYASGEKMRILTISVDKKGNENIELVPERASAGYTRGYADESYLRELPRFNLPFLPSNKTYRAFEISGDSMLPIQPNSIVIGEYVENWIRDIKDGDVCVVVTRTEGIVLKKVYNRSEKTGTLLLKSTNMIYQPYEVSIEDIMEIWKFVLLITKKIPEESTSLEEIKNAYWRLEDELRELRKLVTRNYLS